MRITALISALSFLVLAVIVTAGLTLSTDTHILLAIHQAASASLSGSLHVVTNFADPLLVIPVGLVLAGVLYRRKRQADALLVLLLFTGVSLITSLLKIVFGRVRPELWQGVVHEASASFPSGHASTSMIIACTLCYFAWNRPKLRRLVLVASAMYLVLIGFTRLYFGVHYPSDILGGWLLSLAWFSIVISLAKRPRA